MKKEAGGSVNVSLHEDLKERVRKVLEHAVDAHQKDLKVYESLRSLDEVIGTEYGSRVLYELIQNAHDAHEPNDKGRISIKLTIQSDTAGVLYVANGGNGFREKDLEAIRNLATSAKQVGEGIGNKGLGFRSIEALTDSVQIFSRNSPGQSDRFDGYCFRFAEIHEIEETLAAYGFDPKTSAEVAMTIPRYLVPLPLDEQPKEVLAYARRGYATVVVAPLRTTEAVSLASRQVEALADLDAPLLLFLDRIGQVRIDIDKPGQQPFRRRLQRRQKDVEEVPSLPSTRMYEVTVGEGRRFLVVHRDVDKERVRNAVERSIPSAPQLKRWLDWKGQPAVSVAVGLSTASETNGRLYNFLPMGEEAACPFAGYLDAPFFAEIDRRNADLDLPLNETLMEAAAEACVAAALSIVECDTSLPSHSVFDLFAWTGAESEKLDKAFDEAGSSIREASVIPVISDRGSRAWSNLSDVSIWPEGDFSLLKDREVAKHVGAQLVSSDLDSKRIDRLKVIARRTFRSLVPSSNQLVEWIEAFARSLSERNVAPRTWSRFYDDLPRVFEALDVELESLEDRLILYDRAGKLRAAGGYGGERAGVFIRGDSPKGKRTKSGIPYPPSSLTRRYRFLDDRIKFKRKTLEAFIEAGLIREYDPVDALVGLSSALGKNPNESRRKEALIWAFQVWRAVGERLEEPLQELDLCVPTLSGWKPASQATFSSSWTPSGRKLENYLIEAAEVSADCRRARDLLLIGQQDWPASIQDAKRHWVQFLNLLGVADGLRPISARVTREGSPSYFWNGFLRSGKDTEGLDSDWCAEVDQISFNHPYTDYTLRGEVWRFPGQNEYVALSQTARETLGELLFEHLNAHENEFFEFEIGRFERYERDWDMRVLPTPLATFVRSKAWIPADTYEGLAFKKAQECWAARMRRGGPPRFVDRLQNPFEDEPDSDGFAEFCFGPAVGLRDWQSPMTAVDRLRDLSSVAFSLGSSDRPIWRREHQRAWLDLAETSESLPDDLCLVVTRGGQLEPIAAAQHAEQATVIVTEDAQRLEARVLSSAGQCILEVGSAPIDKVVSLLEATGTFLPRRLDGVGVQLLVDGESFVPRASDPFLSSLSLEWLPEVIVIGHELLGEQLERGIQSSTVDRRARAIRVRRCDAVTLVVDGEEVASTHRLRWYAFEHDELPTLILTNDVVLDWQTLALSLSGAISRLIDGRLRSLERMLSRLALDHFSSDLDAPDDEGLARALNCDVQTVQDHRASLRTDLEHILYMLVPVVAYYGGAELARQIENDVHRTEVKFDVRRWLELNLADSQHSPSDLHEACEQASNRLELLRRLALDYERFNSALVSVGEKPLSNEPELRQLYEAYLGSLRPTIIERLRRHHFSAFRAGDDLALYVERKNLGFLAFDEDWIVSRETLEMDLVRTHVDSLLHNALGKDTGVDLAPFKRVLETNRRTARKFAEEVMPVVRVWCEQNRVPAPGPWSQRDAQSVVRHLENGGILDFEVISAVEMPAACDRVSIWPDGMPFTTDRDALQLTSDAVEEEIRRREEKRKKEDRERRSIQFAGRLLDTSDPGFASALERLAEASLSKDDAWFDRSRQRTRLVEFEGASQGTSGAGGKGKGSGKRQRQLTDVQRQAMGLASEWLAFQFLRRKHGEFVDENCWVSRNRSQFFGGDEGDDSAGFDFEVKTPQVHWLYEVKSSLEDSGEFELTANELRIAGGASKDGRRRYRILYVPYVFSPDRWCVLELPNPMGDATRNRFTMVGRGSVRLRFERR